MQASGLHVEDATDLELNTLVENIQQTIMALKAH
jgi:hypothetical protein